MSGSRVASSGSIGLKVAVVNTSKRTFSRLSWTLILRKGCFGQASRRALQIRSYATIIGTEQKKRNLVEYRQDLDIPPSNFEWRKLCNDLVILK